MKRKWSEEAKGRRGRGLLKYDAADAWLASSQASFQARRSCTLATGSRGQSGSKAYGTLPGGCGAETASGTRRASAAAAPAEASLGKLAKFCKILQIFGGLVLGCIKTKVCKKIIQNMRLIAFFKPYWMCILLHRIQQFS